MPTGQAHVWVANSAENMIVVTAGANAMVTAGSADPKVYLPALKATNYKGVTGNIAFDEKGDIKNGALTLMTYKAGARTTIAVIR